MVRINKYISAHNPLLIKLIPPSLFGLTLPVCCVESLRSSVSPLWPSSPSFRSSRKPAGFLIAHLLACNAAGCLTGISMLISRVVTTLYIQQDCGICRCQQVFYVTFNTSAYGLLSTADLLGAYRLTPTGTCSVVAQTATSRALHTINTYVSIILDLGDDHQIFQGFEGPP
ncbi:hypothetical protein BV898_02378 [Hypsibius exemplaris]|uniref:Uncharacterized protein n=1 Tax=Hypsibius exemplaris TaxID=2072580 RepID=A0A1W0X7Y0_HYPEX|nr:hypothetical protein BV898_02378 [Hypsibius exemplaris]